MRKPGAAHAPWRPWHRPRVGNPKATSISLGHETLFESPESDDRFGSRLCENSPVQFARRKFLLNLVNLKTESAGDTYPRKAIEKPVLRFLGSRTFSHGLGRERTLQLLHES
jgi:hypothetical protein